MRERFLSTTAGERVPIPPGYAVEVVWQSKNEALLAEVVTFWLEQAALTSKEEAEKRAPQVACVVRAVSGKLAGVSTVYQQRHLRFGVEFHYFRCFVAKEHRGANLSPLLLYEVSVHLESRFKQGHDPQVIGVFMEIQNDQVQRNMNQAVWPYLPFVYTGRNARGDHERVYYFDGVRI